MCNNTKDLSVNSHNNKMRMEENKNDDVRENSTEQKVISERFNSIHACIDVINDLKDIVEDSGADRSHLMKIDEARMYVAKASNNIGRKKSFNRNMANAYGMVTSVAVILGEDSMLKEIPDFNEGEKL